MSLFGLLRKIKEHLGVAPTRGQVLLLLRPPGRQRQILNVFLLPGSVPIEELTAQYAEDGLINTVSYCSLTQNQRYSLQCRPTSHAVQPQVSTFDRNYGPHYHPSFEVMLDVNAKEVSLTLLGPDDDIIWQRDITLKDSSDVVDHSNMDITSFSPSVLTEQSANEYRFQFPGAGLFQCIVTGLGFKTTGEGEVVYRAVQWEETWLQSTGGTPAGPLFDIKCPQKTVCQLQLPRCDTTSDDDLSVAHISDEGLDVSKPQKMTETHVVVNVAHLSLFGLLMKLKDYLTQNRPVPSQVLLLLDPPGRRTQQLSVLLLPRNVILDKVMAQHKDYKKVYIENPNCLLIPDQHYRLQCRPTSHKVQPKTVLYYLDFGIYYQASFEVNLDLNAEEVSLQLLGPDDATAWEYHITLKGSSGWSPDKKVSDWLGKQPASSSGYDTMSEADILTGDQYAVPSLPTMMTKSQEAEKLRSVRREFMKRVSEPMVHRLLDKLLEEKVLNDEDMYSIESEKYREEKARLFIDMVTKKGKEASLKMITALHELDPALHHHLGLEKEYLPGASSSQPNMPMTSLQQMEMLRSMMDEQPTEPVLKLLLDNLLDDKVLKDEKINPTRREKYLEEKAQQFITTLHQQDPKLYQRLGLADMRLSDEVDPSNMDITPFSPIVHKYRLSDEVDPSNMDITPFSPIVHKYRFKFPGAGLFQCRLTELVFGTTRAGTVFYKVVSWETWLQSTGMIPAGPLFDIEGPQESVCELHLPHCDITPDGDLSVAHISNDEVNFLEPLKVTETHVVVNVTHLSLFGLTWSFKRKRNPKPIEGQVLLFLRPPRRDRHEMSVFLLPVNVPPEEVKSKYGHYEYIETPRHCHLTPKKVYSVHCPEAHIVQPKEHTFKEDFNQYDELFEVFMDLNSKYFSLEVQGPDKEEVWKRQELSVKAHSRGAAAMSRAGKTRGPSEQDADDAVKQDADDAVKQDADDAVQQDADDDLTDKEKARFVIQQKAELIQKVSTVMAIVDSLGDKVHPEIYAEIHAKETNMERMRILYMYVLQSSGTFIKAAFYNALKQHQAHLLEPLEKASASMVLSEEQFLCPICRDVFTDPITTPCEHSFCKTCITKSWDTTGVCKCPICQKQFYRRPKVSVDRFLAEKADEFRISQQLKETSITKGGFTLWSRLPR